MKTRSLVALLSASLALLAFGAAPTASAHDCEAENPSTSCGECLTGDHRHWYNDYRVYCSSNDDEGVCSHISHLINCNITGGDDLLA